MDFDDALEGAVFTRREAIKIASRTGLTLVTGSAFLSAFAQNAPKPTKAHLIAAPSMTEGPFFVDEKLNRSDIRGTDKRAGVHDALHLSLALTILSGSGQDQFAPLKGAQVDIWHADALGAYSDEPRGLNIENTQGQHWLRGYQLTDANGRVSFQTIFPGWYEGRTTHIHIKVRHMTEANRHATFTSQLFFDDQFADRIFAKAPYRPRPSDGRRNRGDDIYSEPLSDGTPVGQVMTLSPRPTATSLHAEITIALLHTAPKPHTGNPFDFGD